MPELLNGPLFTFKWDTFETQAVSGNSNLAFCVLGFDLFVQNKLLRFTVRDEPVRNSLCDIANRIYKKQFRFLK